LAENPISTREESVSPERDDYGDEDEQDEYAPRSMFAAGWFRAALVLTVLAIVVVISLPYLLNWFEPEPPPRVARQADPPPAAIPTPSAPAAVPIPAEPKPAPPAPEPKAVIVPPAVPPSAPRTVEKTPPKPAETALAPATTRTADADRPVARAAERKLPEKAIAKAEPPAAKAPDKNGRAPATQTAAAKPIEKASPARIAKAEAPAKVQASPVKSEAAPSAKAQTIAVAKSAPAAADKPVASSPAKPASSSNYWIQLGAFKDRQKADGLAKAVRDDGFSVQVTPITRGAAETNGSAQQHELFVTDARVEKVNAALKGRGTAHPAAGGITVRPAFGLQEAMTVSKRLTDEGLKVIIRPASGPVVAGAATLYAVRAGGYPDRSSAVAARDELAGKGHRGFLAEGPPR
jgi:cell division protein FtsN